MNPSYHTLEISRALQTCVHSCLSLELNNSSQLNKKTEPLTNITLWDLSCTRRNRQKLALSSTMATQERSRLPQQTAALLADSPNLNAILENDNDWATSCKWLKALETTTSTWHWSWTANGWHDQLALGSNILSRYIPTELTVPYFWLRHLLRATALQIWCD